MDPFQESCGARFATNDIESERKYLRSIPPTMEKNIAMLIIFDAKTGGGQDWIDCQNTYSLTKIFTIRSQRDWERVYQIISDDTTLEWIVLSSYRSYVFIPNLMRYLNEIKSKEENPPLYLGSRELGRNYGDIGGTVVIHKSIIGQLKDIDIRFSETVGIILTERNQVEFSHKTGFCNDNPYQSIVQTAQSTCGDLDDRSPLSFGWLTIEEKCMMNDTTLLQEFPKILHMIDLLGVGFSERQDECVEMYRNCGWEVMEWTSKRIRKSDIFKRIKRVLEEKGKDEIEVDIFSILKQEILFEYGGAIIDRNLECLRTVEPIFWDMIHSGNDLALPCANENHNPRRLGEGFMVGLKGGLSSLHMLNFHYDYVHFENSASALSHLNIFMIDSRKIFPCSWRSPSRMDDTSRYILASYFGSYFVD